MERVLKEMALRNCLPYWLRRPHDRNIRDDAAASADGSVDPGNYVLDVLVHALRLWQYSESGRIPRVMKQSIAEYGAKSNKSSHGPVNLRGNIVEAMQRNLQQQGVPRLQNEYEYDAIEWWVNWTPAQSQQTWQQNQRWVGTRGSAGSSSSSARYHGTWRW